MVKDKALGRINSILHAWGWGTAFGHSFCIGGASFYLAQKVDPEIVRLAGRWKSMAYEAYIQAFELIANRHMGNLVDDPSASSVLVGLASQFHAAGFSSAMGKRLNLLRVPV